jgi:SAM-dependent methyltransferase
MNNDTAFYFDKYTPEYSVDKLVYAVAAVNRYGPQGGSLIDIGCGTGNTLEFIKSKTALKNLYGMDVSQNCLRKAKESINCDTFLGSILDSSFIEKIPQRFDCALLSAVLHHLIGKTRRESRNYSLSAILNCLKLLKENGHLIIVEPTFYPSIAMDIIFYIKRLSTKITSRRISIFGKWNNIGAPVVSYFTDEQLLEMISGIRHCRIVETNIEEKNLSLLCRLALIKRRRDTTIVVRKTTD